ncbi:MAG: YcxB family protein [Chitinophagaceae bacterium]|nr:YcxB family protein [Chitinophagaceae bacterium]
MTIQFSYDKKEVLQALRYHFISQRELRLMLILVNVFALTSAALFFFKKVTPLAFLLGSFLWFGFMIVIWFVLPLVIYRKAETFKDHFTMQFGEHEFTLGNERGQRAFPWSTVKKMVESPHFFHLYFDTKSFFLVPKDACEDVVGLRKLMREKVGNS